MNTSDKDDLQMLDVADMAQLFRVSKQTIKRRVADGGLPAPIMLCGKSIWHKKTVENWIIEQHGGEAAVKRKRDLDELC